SILQTRGLRRLPGGRDHVAAGQCILRMADEKTSGGDGQPKRSPLSAPNRSRVGICSNLPLWSKHGLQRSVPRRDKSRENISLERTGRSLAMGSRPKKNAWCVIG